jgi:hypothetical protein
VDALGPRRRPDTARRLPSDRGLSRRRGRPGFLAVWTSPLAGTERRLCPARHPYGSRPSDRKPCIQDLDGSSQRQMKHIGDQDSRGRCARSPARAGPGAATKEVSETERACADQGNDHDGKDSRGASSGPQEALPRGYDPAAHQVVPDEPGQGVGSVTNRHPRAESG